MAKESTQKKVGRVRPPRVHIEYEVEIGDAMVKKELPFVVGVMGDFSGKPTKKLRPFSQREFIPIDRDNFDEVMQRMAPGASFRVENTLKGDGSELGVQLSFESMDDFEPAAVVKQVEPLRRLLETRDKLRDLLTKVDRSDDLESLLEQVLENTDQLKSLAADLGVSESGSSEPEKEE